MILVGLCLTCCKAPIAGSWSRTFAYNNWLAAQDLSSYLGRSFLVLQYDQMWVYDVVDGAGWNHDETGAFLDAMMPSQSLRPFHMVWHVIEAGSSQLLGKYLMWSMVLWICFFCLKCFPEILWRTLINRRSNCSKKPADLNRQCLVLPKKCIQINTEEPRNKLEKHGSLLTKPVLSDWFQPFIKMSHEIFLSRCNHPIPRSVQGYIQTRHCEDPCQNCLMPYLFGGGSSGQQKFRVKHRILSLKIINTF